MLHSFCPGYSAQVIQPLMGKKRVVSKEEEDELEENLKRAKKPLQLRDGILSRTEYLRQVFQGKTFNSCIS